MPGHHIGETRFKLEVRIYWERLSLRNRPGPRRKEGGEAYTHCKDPLGFSPGIKIRYVPTSYLIAQYKIILYLILPIAGVTRALQREGNCEVQHFSGPPPTKSGILAYNHTYIEPYWFKS